MTLQCETRDATFAPWNDHGDVTERPEQAAIAAALETLRACDLSAAINALAVLQGMDWGDPSEAAGDALDALDRLKVPGVSALGYEQCQSLALAAKGAAE